MDLSNQTVSKYYIDKKGIQRKKYKKNGDETLQYKRFLKSIKNDKKKLIRNQRKIVKDTEGLHLLHEEDNEHIYDIQRRAFVKKSRFLNEDGTLKESYKKKGYELNEYGHLVNKEKETFFISLVCGGWSLLDLKKDKLVAVRGRTLNLKDDIYAQRSNFYFLSGKITKKEYDVLQSYNTYFMLDANLNEDPKKMLLDIFKPISRFEGYEDLFSNVYHLYCMGYIDMISFENIKIIQALKNKQIVEKWEDVVLLRSLEEKMYCYKYLSYKTIEGKLDISYQTEYIQKNFINNACIITAVIDLFKKSFDKKYANKLTYETLWKMIHEDRKYDYTNLGMTLQDIKRFFQKYKLALYCYDINYNLIWHTDPRDEGVELNRNIYPRVMYALIHNNHFETLNHNTDVLEKIKHRQIENNYINEPTDRFRFRKYNTTTEKTVIDLVCNSPIEVFDIICKYEDMDINIYYNGDLLDVFRYFKREHRYECGVDIDNQTVCALYISNINKNKICIKTINTTDSIVHVSSNELIEFKQFKDSINRIVLNKNHLSVFNHRVKEMLYENMRGAIVGKIGGAVEGLIEIDYNRFYCSILQQMEYFMSVSVFDDFEPYKGEQIHDYNLYYVHNRNNILTYPRNKYSLCYGRNIRDLDNIEIISVLQPSHLHLNNVGEEIEKLYSSECLSNECKKWIVNFVIGLCGKKRNSLSKGCFSTSIEEVKMLYNKYGGGVYDFGENNDPLYLHYVNRKKELEDGFLLIQHYIYDTAEKMMFDLMERLERYGITTEYIKTDALFITNNEYNKQRLEKFKQNMFMLFDFTDKNSYDAIGKLKISYNKNIKSGIGQFLDLRLNSCMTCWKYKDNVAEIHIKNEWDLGEIQSILRTNKNVYIQALYGGCGKSYSCKKSFNNPLFVYPWNNQKQQGHIEGLESRTCYNLFNLNIDGEEKGGMVKDLREHDAIIFDEVNLNSPYILQYIYMLIKKNKQMCIHATGDYLQNKPVDFGLNNIRCSPTEYLQMCIHKTFNKTIILQINKRCKDHNLLQKLKVMRQMVNNKVNKSTMVDYCLHNFKVVRRMSEIPTMNISYYNSYKDKINKHLCKGNEDIWVSNETFNIDRKTKIYVNYLYKVLEKTDKYAVLNDFYKDIVVDVKYFNKFNLNYCRTGHSLQGLSINEPYCIHNIRSPHVDNEWIYTAVLRTTDPSFISFYDDTYTETISDAEIQYRIELHRQTDIQKQRICDLDVEWVKKNMRSSCIYCGCCIDKTNWSVDRLDNMKGHTKDNCHIICFKCNVTKK